MHRNIIRKMIFLIICCKMKLHSRMIYFIVEKPLKPRLGPKQKRFFNLCFHLMNALDRHFLPKSTLWKQNVLETAYQVTITKFNLDLVFMGKNKDINHSKATNTHFLFLSISTLHLFSLTSLYDDPHWKDWMWSYDWYGKPNKI